MKIMTRGIHFFMSALTFAGLTTSCLKPASEVGP